MATYRVWSGGDGTAPTTTDWTKAYATLAAALAAATTDGDKILIHYTHTEELAADTFFSIGANNLEIWTVDKDNGEALTPMGTGAWIGNSTTNRFVTFTASNRTASIYGLTIRTAYNTSDSITFSGDGGHWELHSCYFWQGNTVATAGIFLGATADHQTYVHAVNCTFRFGNAGQSIYLGSRVLIEGGGISASGSAITLVARGSSVVDTTGGYAEFHGFDMSAAAATATILGNSGIYPLVLRLYGCKLPSGAFSYITAQTHENLSSVELWMHDCAAGDSHLGFVHANPFGSTELQTGIYYTATGAAWKVTTTAAANFMRPYVTPWVDLYHSGAAAITPYFEIARDGSSTAFKDAEVWGEFSVKNNSGTVLPSFVNDAQSFAAYLAGTAGVDQDAGAGLASWTGESGTAWSGKVNSGASVTPAEVGYLRGRVAVGATSSIVYVDPVIRT